MKTLPHRVTPVPVAADALARALHAPRIRRERHVGAAFAASVQDVLGLEPTKVNAVEHRTVWLAGTSGLACGIIP